MTGVGPIPFAMLGSGLFRGLSAEHFQRLLAAVSLVELAEGAYLFREGDEADALYVVLEGSVQVLSEPRKGEAVVLARLRAGEHFGEQALLELDGRRSASVRASEAATLVRVAREQFDACITSDAELRERLLQLGAAQREENVARRTELVRALLADHAAKAEEVRLKPGAVLFRQGEEPDAAYVVLSGKIGLYVDRDGQPVRLSAAGAGACVGELGALGGGKRAATAIADDAVRALRVRAETLPGVTQRSEQVRSHVATLQRVYALPFRGFVTQYGAEIDGTDYVSLAYHLGDGRKLAVSHAVGGEALELETDGASGLESVRSPDGTLDLAIDADRRIVRISATRSSETIAELVRRAVDGTSLGRGELQALAEGKGLAGAADEIVCRCLKVSESTLKAMIEDDARSLTQLQQLTGCGSVCGTCVPRLLGMLGRSEFSPVVVVSSRDLASEVRAFRLGGAGDRRLPASRPGQHVILRARIDGREIDRPYTLSSAAGERWEVTIRREPSGLFSNFMFEHGKAGTRLEASAPRGSFVWDGGPNPVVCFVAGIGVTPVLAFVRTLNARGWPQRLVVDWSARHEGDFVCQDELQVALAARSNVTVKWRLTSREPRLAGADVEAWANRFPSARFFVCGSDGFNADVRDWLDAAGVPSGHVNVERFVASAASVPADAPPPTSHGIDRGRAARAAEALKGTAPASAAGQRARVAAELLEAWSASR